MILKNKIVVITGASKGLGFALAGKLIQNGARVIISARKKRELMAAAKSIGALPVVADVTKEADMRRLAAFAIKRFGRLDMWVNNAGTTLPHSEIGEIEPKLARRVMEVNFWGTFNGARAAMRVLKRGGAILNIVSMSALVGRPRSAGYASSKWAVRGFSESLRLALEPKGVSVLMAHPGGIKTTIFGTFKPKGYETWMEASFVAREIVKNLKRNQPKKDLVINAIA